MSRRDLSHSSQGGSSRPDEHNDDLIISPANDRPGITTPALALKSSQEKSRSEDSAYGRYEEPPTRQRSWLQKTRLLFGKGGKLQPFRLLIDDQRNIRQRWVSDWTLFNQLILASAVYVFFTNILPGITFASDLYVLTGQAWGTIEVVFSTGMCGIIFSL